MKLAIVIILSGLVPLGLFAQTESPANGDIAQLRALLAEQQKQIDQLKSALEEQKKLISTSPAVDKRDFVLPRNSALGEIASTSPILPPTPVAALPAAASGSKSVQEPTEETSPLQFMIGDAYITPVGFMDFTSVYRSHTAGSGIGTNFASIPYGNVFQNNLSEMRMSMQNSRIGFRVDALVKGAHVLGYMESDFLGNNPGNVAVSSNSNTLRSRLYWADVRKGRWEVLGGQSWSLITPGRSGISPLTGDVFYSQAVDTNYHVGLVWGRIPEVRVVYHPSDKAAFAVALDSSEQYVGGSAGGPLVTFPAALVSAYPGGELNNGATTMAVPNVAPDLIAKFAFDPSARFHVETGGVERAFKLWNPLSGTHFSAMGGGVFLNFNYVLRKGLRFLTNNFWSDGGGRYIYGQVPDLIARVDGSPSLIHASSTVSGFEYTKKSTTLYSYYGGVYAGRNIAVDTSGKPVGYGYTGAPSGQNRTVQEASFGFFRNFWKDPKYGALALAGQYSYLSRNPWSVAPAQPADAHLNMLFWDLRYTLPGAPPSMK